MSLLKCFGATYDFGATYMDGATDDAPNDDYGTTYEVGATDDNIAAFDINMI